jgi:hypothetical protein
MRTSQTAFEVPLRTSPAAMQNRLWSSTPVTTLLGPMFEENRP